MTLTDVEASFFRYLYEQLEVPLGIRVFEDITLEEYADLEKWVVIETLTNITGYQPKQLYFIHMATQNNGKRSKEVLIRLVDQVMQVINKGTTIVVYDYDDGQEIGGMEVQETSLSPVMPHFSGGAFRSLTVGVTYVAETN